MSVSGSVSRSERATLSEFLGYQRESLIGKLDGLTAAEARSTPTASSLSLLSLVKHSAIWERRWFQIVVAGRITPGDWPEAADSEPSGDDPTFQLADDDTTDSVVADYRTQMAISNEILTTVELDAECAMVDFDENVRWVVVHMIEETARHAGHADLIRETIDGSQGR